MLTKDLLFTHTHPPPHHHLLTPPFFCLSFCVSMCLGSRQVRKLILVLIRHDWTDPLQISARQLNRASAGPALPNGSFIHSPTSPRLAVGKPAALWRMEYTQPMPMVNGGFGRFLLSEKSLANYSIQSSTFLLFYTTPEEKWVQQTVTAYKTCGPHWLSVLPVLNFTLISLDF